MTDCDCVPGHRCDCWDYRAAPQDDREALDLAWGIIANAGGGDWTKETPEWQAAAARWRDKHYGPPAPQDDREAEPGLRELAEKLNEALSSGQWGRKGALPFGGPIDQAHEALDIWLSNHPARPQAPESPTDG